MLNISPFSYGLLVEQVYDSGTIFAPEILDIKPEDLREKFLAGVANLAAVCLSIGYPTTASAPHSIANGFKNLLAIAAVTEVEFKEATTIKEYIKVGGNELLLLQNLMHIVCWNGGHIFMSRVLVQITFVYRTLLFQYNCNLIMQIIY